MNRIDLLKRAAVLLRDPATIGDGALLKSLAFSDRGSAEVRTALAPFRATLPAIDDEALATMPEGSFGLSVSRFCRDNGIRLLKPNPVLLELAEDRVVAVRYAATHDLVHVLIDEGTDFAGEAAVYAFSVAQGYSRMHAVALALACLVWPMMRPSEALRIWRGARRGFRKGRRSALLLAHRFEDRFAAPLDEVRRECGVVV